MPGDFHTLLGNPGTTPQQDRDCALVLAGHARDAVELRLFLEICGLLPYESGDHAAYQAERAPAAVTSYRRPGA